MDITMPKIDGVTATKEILKRDPGALIVMVTSVGQEGVMRECIMAGARDFITKPFQEARIISALRRVLGLDEKVEPPDPPAVQPQTPAPGG
jgi:two-component system chemotaxis response regulator CheY